MQDIQTTGGLFTKESRKIVVSYICRVFDCEEIDIEELIPVQAGLTNVVLSFRLNGGKYASGYKMADWKDALVEYLK